MAHELAIRPVETGDAGPLSTIYAHHVIHGTASYETQPPDAEEFARRIARVRDAGWPWLVAVDRAGELVGYAYATQFRDRAAYRFVCEDSIYIRHDRRGEGIGKALLSALLGASQAYGFRQMIAVIGGAEPASAALHASLGFTEVGRLSGIGRKHGRWLDTLYMQLPLGEGAASPPAEEPQ